MFDYFYVCIAFNDNLNYDFPIQSYSFFKTIYEARNDAFLRSEICFFGYSHPELYLNYYNEIFVDIYKVPFGVDISTGENYIDIRAQFSGHFVRTIRSRKSLAIEIIQKYYKIYFKRKMDSIIFLQFALRKAIANPYTLLCRKRLLREFNELVQII